MFTAERWASAFVNAAGENRESAEGLSALKALIPCIRRIPGTLSGSSAARQLERMFRAAIEKSGASSRGMELACRILLLLVKKGLFRHSNAVLDEIENIVDRKNGVLKVIVDSAFPVDKEFEEVLKARIKQQMAVQMDIKEIKLMIRIMPELLGGYRLHIGGESLDASLRLLLQEMAAYLQTVPKETVAGGFSW